MQMPTQPLNKQWWLRSHLLDHHLPVLLEHFHAGVVALKAHAAVGVDPCFHLYKGCLNPGLLYQAQDEGMSHLEA
jgi:hypothetical protein